MQTTDPYGYRLSTSPAAASAYVRGIGDILRLRAGALTHIAESIAHDPTFALGHAALALLGHEMCAPVDVDARLRQARALAGRTSERERSHVHAIASHIQGDSRPLIDHVAAFPRDALLLSSAVPTIAFAGATEVPEESWAIVERCIPAYGDDWWFTGLLAFVRQEQHRYDEALALSCRSLEAEPGAGHSAHARAHAHYETGDHETGLAWMDRWVTGPGAEIDSLSHFSWHAALHELSLGDLEAVRRRYESQLQPGHALGCRALVDSGSLLFRWALTPGAAAVPSMTEVVRVTGRATMERPATPFLALHTAVALLALDDAPALRDLATWARGHRHRTFREVVSPLADALGQMVTGSFGAAADALALLSPQLRRLGGSDAQREIVEEARIAALLRAERWDEARMVLDRRLDRRRSPRDETWRAEALGQARGQILGQALVTPSGEAL